MGDFFDDIDAEEQHHQTDVYIVPNNDYFVITGWNHVDIAEDIKEAIGDEKDPYKACCLNVRHCCRRIEGSLSIQEDEKRYGLRVMGAVYDLETGEVKFL